MAGYGPPFSFTKNVNEHATRPKIPCMTFAKWSFAAVLSVAFLFAGLSRAQTPSITNLPATFIGTLPCADCPGIVYQINLLPDRTFVSRMTYQERNNSFDEHGSWEISKNGKILMLKAARGRPQQFSIPDADTLRQLDANGHEIQSKFNYDLKRASAFASLASK